MFKNLVLRALHRIISRHFYSKTNSNFAISKSNLFVLSCLIGRTYFNAGTFLCVRLMQVALDEKNKKPRIVCRGVITTFTQHMVDFNISYTKLPKSLGRCFLLLRCFITIRYTQKSEYRRENRRKMLF